MNKRLVMIIVGIVVVVGGFIFITRPRANAPSSANASPSNHVMGANTKNVTLIEYGDYQCPACGQYYPVVKQVTDKYQNDILFQFRNFPLESIHKNARAGARAAEAADLQGKYWEMHDQLYENQNTWAGSSDPLSFFEGYAKAVGITDMAKFDSDYKSASVNAVINADLKEGQAIGANSTPTFVLDGTKVTDNPHSVEAFYKLIDDAIAKKNP